MNRKISTPESTARQFTVRLSSTRRGARLARLLAVEQLRLWGHPLDAASHVIAELATNAASHGRTPGRDFRLTLMATDDTIRIEVTDTRGDLRPIPQLPDDKRESGRGLLLVKAFADRWGTVDGPRPCKTVWAEIDMETYRDAPCTASRHRPCRDTDSGQ